MSTSLIAEIVDLTTICPTFPDIPNPEINRDNYLNTIEDLFNDGIEMVAIEGREGIGKTTLLAQFGRRHPYHAISIFIKPVSRSVYDPDTLRMQLSDQIEWILYGKTANFEDIDERFLQRRLYQLQRYATRKKEIYYFIVDGIQDIPEKDIYFLELILDMLPFSFTGFRFLFSGTLEKFPIRIRERIRHKQLLLTGFNLDQTYQYLGTLGIEKIFAEEVQKVCKGVPAYLASIKRILDSGTEIDNLLPNLPSHLPELFEIEWRKVQSDERKQTEMLALIALSEKKLTISDLARMTQSDEVVITGLVNSFGFLSITPEGFVSFVSDTFQQFAANHLNELEEHVTESIIKDLSKDPQSEEALSFLPQYLEKAKKFEDLLNYLSPETFFIMLQRGQSFGSVHSRANSGLETAINLRKNGDIVRFGLQKSMLSELIGGEVWRSEVEACLALKNYDGALALAQSTLTKEERLHLLAVVAKGKRLEGLTAEPELLEQIKELFEQIDPKILRSKSLDIASELLYTIPELAIRLIEKATKGDHGDNSLDWAFAQLSIAAMVADKELPQTNDTLESVRSYIKDPKAQSFSATMSSLIGDFSSKQIIAETEKLEEVNERIYLLRQWSMENREREDAIEVVEFALDTIIKSTEYAPNARVYREIATPLPLAKNTDMLKEIVGKFDAQKGTIEEIGPTEEYIRLSLILAHAESIYDREGAGNRLVDVYFLIENIDDLSIKSTCLGRLVTTLAEIDPLEQFEGSTGGIHSVSKDELHSNIRKLIDNTGEQYEVTKGVIRSLVKTQRESALELAINLNREERRDLALFDIVESSLQVPGEKLPLEFITKAIGLFVDPNLRDDALLSVLAKLAVISKEGFNFSSDALKMINLACDVRVAFKRCNALSLAYAAIKGQRSEKYESLEAHLLNVLMSSWESIDIGWRRVDAGYKIVEVLADYSLEFARKYMDLTDQFREEILLDTEPTALSFLGCIRLAIRAFGGLLPRKADNPEDLTILANIISKIPSRGERAGLWKELSLQFYTHERPVEGNRIVNEHLRPLIQNFSEGDVGYREDVIVDIAPALYCCHRKLALDELCQLPLHKRDDAYLEICEFVLRKQSPSDPYDSTPDHVYNLQVTDLTDICEILDLMEDDGMIYRYINVIANNICQRRDRYTRQQVASIIEKLNKTITSKFPSPRFIKHAGYIVIANVQISRIQRARTQEWMDLIEMAYKIPNVSDRAFCLGIIAVDLPQRESNLRQRLIGEMEDLLNQIPSIYDRIDRYATLAEMMMDVNVSISKKLLELAMKSAVATDDPDVYPIQRKIVDLAYRVDENLASSLASLADNDPARASAQRNLRQRLQLLELKKKMVDQPNLGDELIKEGNISRAAWMNLGALNAGRIANLHQGNMYEYLRAASALPLTDAYPILAWVIENANQRFSKTDQAMTILRPIYEALLMGATFIEQLINRSSHRMRKFKSQILSPDPNSNLLIRSNEREKAFQFLRNWFENNVFDYLKICDPYFGPEDLEILLALLSANPSCDAYILTSKKHNIETEQPWDETYRNYWRIKISDQNPPNTEIYIVGTQSSGILPIHDRWLLTKDSGIRVGTSFNSLGRNRDSEISVLSKEEANNIEARVDKFINREIREHMGEKLLYTFFTL